MKVRKKPVDTVAAYFATEMDPVFVGQLSEMLHRSNSAFVLERGYAFRDGVRTDEYLALKLWTIDGNLVNVANDSYVVIDSEGYAYPCAAKVFEAAYDPVPDIGP